MKIHRDISLKGYNTFGIEAKAKYFISVPTVDLLKQALLSKTHPIKFILGGGSNLLISNDIDALVIHLNIKGISIVSETQDHVLVKANAGENWHDFVLWCLEHNFGGIENLSLIPGNVGTAPIQNIGAYGVELKDTFVECTTIHSKDLSFKIYSKNDCKFGYRDSVFKNDEKGKHIITDVTFKLTKQNHQLYVSYGAILSELKKNDIQNPTIQDVSGAVVAIRQSKLPDPKDIGNSGSFFKNPVISLQSFNDLKKSFNDIPSYPNSETKIKIPAAWLIEKAGFKGKRFGDYGIHEKQALVLVNYGAAKGEDILELSKLIQDTILRIFGISLETEVNII